MNTFDGDIKLQPSGRRQPIGEVFSKIEKIYGYDIEDIRSSSISPVEADLRATEAAEVCVITCMDYFLQRYHPGDPLHDVVNYMKLLASRFPIENGRPSRFPNIPIVISDRLSLALERLNIKEIAGDPDIFEEEIATFNDYFSSSTPAFIGRYDKFEARTGSGNGDRHVINYVKDIGFVYIPVLFYDKCMTDPLEALCDTLKMAHDSVSFFLGKVQKNGSHPWDGGHRLVHYFLNRIMKEDHTLVGDGYITGPLEDILNDESLPKRGREKLVPSIAGTLFQINSQRN